MKKFFIGLVLLLLSAGNIKATHLMGGEITWICLPGGQFQFTMKLYRDCNGTQDVNVANIEVFNYPTAGAPTYFIPVTLISQNDISPVCNGTGPTISCANPNGSAGAVEEFIYQSGPITLTGTPPAEGWIFSYDACCRNAAVTNIVNAGNEGFTLRAKMFAFNGQNTDPCYDASPVFVEKPSTIICAGYPFTYNHNAVDSELDSLSYNWANALDDFSLAWDEGTQPPLLTYPGGYSATSPLPGTAQNPSNVPAQLNVNTGEISFTSFTAGNFVTVVKVEAWKCGTLVAEIYREIQVTILSGCATNTKPTVSPFGGIFTGYSATVTAGDLVTFNLTGNDPEFLPNGNPQTVSINATGSQFGTGFTNTAAGCLNPPCATLNPPPLVSGPNTASTTFTWQTDCNHIAYDDICAATSNTYTFVFRVADDFCPAPAVNIITVSVTVEAWPVVPPPSFRCASVLPNGDVQLTWVPPLDPDNRFNSYHIFQSASENGPYTDIDSIFQY